MRAEGSLTLLALRAQPALPAARTAPTAWKRRANGVRAHGRRLSARIAEGNGRARAQGAGL